MNKSIVLNTLKELGWNVTKEDTNTYNLQRYSDAGHDLNITIKGKSCEALIDSIYSCYEDFDVSYETYLWLDDTGHGKNGAPYEMREVLEDMEACEKMIYEAYLQTVEKLNKTYTRNDKAEC